MSIPKNISHWYDGWIYAKFIAWHQRYIFDIAVDVMGMCGNVLDVACGTGEFAIQKAKYCDRIVGIDLSKRNIGKARETAREMKLDNVEFIHGDAYKMKDHINEKFDYAIISFAIHEMPRSIREDVIRQMLDAADKVIIADYASPQPINFRGAFNYLVEFFAGIQHFRNFRDYQSHTGIRGLVKKIGAKVRRREELKSNSTTIIEIE